MHRMPIPRVRQAFTALLGAFITLSLVSMPTLANHAWGSYHWQRTTTGPLTLDVVDNTTTGSGWSAYLDQTINEWDAGTLGGAIGAWAIGSRVTDLSYVSGNPTKDPKKCAPVVKTIQVCNADYGRNGWMGIAQIWTSGSHITQANAKLNDYYFTPSWYSGFPADEQQATLAADRLLVMCQEIAHGYGLDHQDEGHYNENLGSCMDYTADPNGGISNGFDYGDTNEHPNQHDFEMLAHIYNHTDTVSTTGGKGGKNRAEPAPQAEEALGNTPTEWGEVIATDGQGRPSHYKKDLGGGRAAYTFVIHADNTPDAQGGTGQANGGHSHDGGHSHEGTADTGGHSQESDQGKQADSKQDGGKKQESGKRDSKRDGKQADGKRDGGAKAKKDQGRHSKRGR